MDLSVIHQYLTNSYWAKGISLDTVKESVDNSLCFGVFLESGEQVGFARVITDKATFAYLGDVFILRDYRTKGLGKLLMKEVLSHPDLQGLRRMILATRDAHSLYEKFGFTSLANPQTFMELRKAGIYTNKN